MRRKADAQVAIAGAMLPEGSEQNPFASLAVPPFAEKRTGQWWLRLQPKEQHPRKVRGYFTPGYQTLEANWHLLHFDAPDAYPTTWMSVTPMELESQAHHLHAAQGLVLIGGLGMGVLAWNVAQKESVREVIVVERDPSIIDLTHSTMVEQGWSSKKITILNDDLFKFRSSLQFDVALLDIWPSVGDERLRGDLQRVAKSIRAKEYAAWGLEFDFVSWLAESKIPARRASEEHRWSQYSQSIGVPLILRDHPRMAALAMQAVVNGMKHETDKMLGIV
jgi:hypothetical protein